MTLRVLVLVCACLLAPGCAMLAQAVDPKDKAAARIEALQQATRPEVHHEHLKALAGRFEQEIRWWTEPSGEAHVSHGFSEVTVIMGGRYVKQQVQSERAGEAFHGLGLLGYDKRKGKYVSVWIDNLSSGIMASEGTCDGTGKVFTFLGSYEDVQSGRKGTARTVTRILDPNRQQFEMYGTAAGGREFKMLEITSTRQRQD